MGATGLEVFDQTLQKTNIWLKQIMEDLGLIASVPITPCARSCTVCATA